MANKKIDLLKKEADTQSMNQIDDIFSQINSLDVSSKTNSDEITIKPVADFKSVTTNEIPVQDDKPGYISLVIPNSLKKTWKNYSNNHGMSLTDCIKLGMKLLEDMENKQKISIDSGFITYRI